MMPPRKQLKKRTERRQAAYIFKEDVLEQILLANSCDIGHYLQWAKENNKLYTGTDPNHKYKRQTQIDGGRKWCYMVYLPSQLEIRTIEQSGESGDFGETGEFAESGESGDFC